MIINKISKTTLKNNKDYNERIITNKFIVKKDKKKVIIIKANSRNYVIKYAM